MTVEIENHVDLAIARLKSMHRQPNIEKLVTALTTVFTDLEQAINDVFYNRNIYTAVGAQLDAIGLIVGQARNGLDDDSYRRYILAKISTNKSTGTVEELITVTFLILNDESILIEVEQQPPAGVVVRIPNDIISEAIADIIISFLRKMVAGGVRILFEYASDADDDSFHMAQATFLNGSHSSGATTLLVDSTDGFPDSGSLDIDIGLAAEETVTYTGKTATSFIGVSSTANAHGDNACVQLADAPGLGFDTTSVVELLENNSTSVGATSYATGSVSPDDNDLLLLGVTSAIAAGGPNTPTITWLGLTWTLVDSLLTGGGGVRRLSVFRASGVATPGTGTIDFASQTQESIAWQLVQIHIGNSVVKSDNDSGTTVTADLTPLADSGNMHIAFATAGGGDWVPDAQFLEVNEETEINPTIRQSVMYAIGEDTCEATAGVTNSVIIGVEVDFDPTGGALSSVKE